MREDLKVLMNLLCALPTLTYSFSVATLKGRFKTEQHKTKHFFYREAKEGPEVLVPKDQYLNPDFLWFNQFFSVIICF